MYNCYLKNIYRVESLSICKATLFTNTTENENNNDKGKPVINTTPQNSWSLKETTNAAIFAAKLHTPKQM